MKPNLTLVGRVCRDHLESRTLPPSDKTERIKVYVQEYFWSGAIYVHQEEQLSSGLYPYPDYFAAGWFTQANTNGEVKQSIIVAPGSSMADARQKMLAIAQKLDWGN